MEKILVADDEERFRKLVCSFLKKDGYNVVEAQDGKEALEIALSDDSIVLAVLDVMMPYASGFDVCQVIKQEKDIPIIILTAKSEDEDQIQSFTIGADDYISKPVNFSILLLRIKALLKRTTTKYESLYFDDIEINLNAHEARKNGEILALPKKEFEILVLLLQNKNRVLTREEIKDSVWEDSKNTDIRAVDTHIKNLRIKLGCAGDKIKTIRGYGYKIE